MKKTIFAVLVGLVLVSVALYLYTRQKPAPKAAELLPETTLLYVGLPDFPQSRADFRQTQMYALWQEPTVQAFLEKPRAVLRELAGTRKSDSVLDVFLEDRVLGLLEGEVFLAVTHISPPPAVAAGLVLGADVKQKKLEAQAFLKVLEHDLARQFPNASAAEKRYLGTNYEVWQLTDKLNVCHTFLNSLLVFTLDENLLRDLITRFAGQAPPDAKTLAASARFQKVLKQAPAGHEASVYLNVEQLLGLFGPLLALSPQTGGFIQKFASMEAAGTSVTFTDGLVEDFSVVQYTGTNHVVSPTVERRTLSLTAPDTSLYAVRASELAASYRQTMDSIALAGNATLTTMAVEFDRTLNQRGLRFADDILANMGPELALIATWREGSRLPDMALVAEVKNTDALRPKFDIAMEALKDAAPIPEVHQPWDAQSYLGETLHTLHVGAEVVSPSYVITDKFLILSLTADYARALVQQSKSSGTTLVGNARFTDTLRRVPASTTSFTYCDLPSVLVALYAQARANAPANDYVDFSNLPPIETLTKHLAPFVSATVDTPAAQSTTTFSTLGKPLTILAGVAGTLAAAQPLLAELPDGFIPGLPTMSSGNPPVRNRMAPSQTPPP
jgi:hypothetical protein